RQAAAPRVFADRLLGPIADGEDGARELRLGQREQKVRLILRGIGAAPEQMASARAVALDARVVAGRDGVGAEAARPLDERRKLQVAVAARARQRRAARGVLAHEIRDDVIVELPLE